MNFKPASAQPKKRLIVSIEGPEKTGKTHFALTGGGKTAVLNLDHGLEGVAPKFVGNGSDVQEVEYWLPDIVDPAKIEQKIVKAYESIWNQYFADYKEALANFDTVLLDTGDEAWEMVRIARLGKLTQVMPNQYGPVNAEFRQIFNLAKQSNANLLINHRMNDEYVNDKPTGRLKRAGFKNTAYEVQINLRSSKKGSDFQMQIIDCRHDPDLDGKMIEPPTFERLQQMIFTNNNPTARKEATK